jgi:hypothetical protein
MRKLGLICLLLLGACQVYEPDSPGMVTQDAQEIGSTSVVMEGKIEVVGPVKPIHYGFLWDTGQDLTVVGTKNMQVLGSSSEPRTFSIRLDNLVPATTYYYRCFSANDGYSKIYYGNVVSFTTLP